MVKVSGLSWAAIISVAHINSMSPKTLFTQHTLWSGPEQTLSTVYDFEMSNFKKSLLQQLHFSKLKYNFVFDKTFTVTHI